MEESLLNQESVDNLQQMSKDMKHHIAQLKAELANDDFGSQKLVSGINILVLKYTFI